MHTITMLALTEQPPSFVDSLANNNPLFLSIELLACSIIAGIAMRYNLKEWKIGVIVGLTGVATSVSYVLISHSSLLFYDVIRQVLPFMALTAWMLSASYFRHRVNLSISSLRSSINNDIESLRDDLNSIPKLIADSIQQYHDDISSPPKENILSIDLEQPIGQRTDSNIKLRQIMDDLMKLQLPVRREHGKAYLGNFVVWTCKISRLECNDGKITLALMVYRDRGIEKNNGPIKIPNIAIAGAIVSVTIPEANNPRLKLMKNGDDVIVDGRISQLCIEPLIITIDNAIITIKEMNSDKTG